MTKPEDFVMRATLWLTWATIALALPAAGWAQGAFPADPPPEGQRVPPIKQASPAAASPDPIPAPNREAAPATAEEEDDTGQATAVVEVPAKILEVEPGDNLALLAEKAYGSSGYWRILKLHNEVDPTKLMVGETIEAPDLMALLKASGLLPLFEDAVGDLMKGRQAFTEAEMSLRKAQEAAGAFTAEEGDGKKLEESSRLITAGLDALGDRREGVTGVPTSTIQQLRTAATLVDEIAKGDVTSAKLTEVHERLGNALTYAVLWAREGFK